MSSLSVPDTGMTIKPPSAQTSTSLRPAIGLTLPDGIIEAMIKCVQAGNPIQLSLSENPTRASRRPLHESTSDLIDFTLTYSKQSISYGEKIQHLGLAKDSRPREVFRTTSSNPVPCDSKGAAPHPSPNTFTSLKMTSTLAAMINQTYCPTKSSESASQSVSNPTKSSTTAGADAALAALQNSLASESIKKAENTVKYIKDGSLTIPGKRGPSKLGSSSRYLDHNRSNNDLNKPSLSPQLASTAVPLSQQQAVQAKAARKPVIHLLAVGPLSEDALGSKVPDATSRDLKQALEKVGDLNESSGKWELRKTFFKELDVWEFNYDRPEDRQRAIDNAVKIFDKMRLNVSEPQWEKLLPRSERATGKCLSRLQAQIAQGSNQKASKPTEQSRDPSPTSKDDGGYEKPIPKKSDSSLSTHTSTTKPKKTPSAKEAQAKRLASKKPPSAKPTRVKSTTVAPVPKKKGPAPAKETKVTSRMLSSEYVQSSDDEAVAPAEVIQTKAIKRPREQDETPKEASRPGVKKARKDAVAAQRVPEASQTRVTNTTLSSSSSSKSAKSNSPRKSSPLASSPPTNASDLELSTGSQSPNSGSRSNVQKRHAPDSSISPSSSTTSRRLRPEVTDLARKYKMYYPKYLQLHEQLTEMGERRDRHLEKDLLEMHARLYTMKKEIMAGVIEVG
ncbi:hypothetical protein BGHDH14_bgh03053 [Blumeria hordei DH14]|uniref:Uncharacterized protein n=1 Tax=Blumeria graminis f. sp. hordei (strain DH14) TaxID=546991 RepID=N1JKG2_BLUG1|nr:hypothetical protein BGHDH14_bgh03053 [Blumeria hordei DH14]